MNDQELDSFLNNSKLFNKINPSDGFHNQLMTRLESEQNRKFNGGMYQLSGNVFRTVVLAVILTVNLTSIAYYYRIHNITPPERNEMLMTFAEAYAIDQTNFNLLTINNK